MAGEQRAFQFLRMNQREDKPRSHGVTEIRGPYYTPMGSRYLQDVLETDGRITSTRSNSPAAPLP